MVCKRELGGETRRQSGAIRGTHRGRLEAGIRADEVGEGEGRSRMGMMCYGKRVAWPPCGTRSPTKHSTLQTRKAQDPRGTTRRRWKRTSYFAILDSGMLRLKNKRVWGCSKAVPVEVSALSAVPVADHAPSTDATRTGVPGRPVRHVLDRSPLSRSLSRAAPATRALYSWLPVTQTPTLTDTPRAARAGSAHGSATHSVASHVLARFIIRVALTRAWTRRRGACLRLSPARCRRASRALRWS